MNINKFKNLLIIFLAVINAGLLILNINENMRYSMTNRQESAIRSLLSGQGISLYEMPVRDFSPMRNLSMTPVEFDRDHVIEIFFGSLDGIIESVEYGMDVYRLEDKSLYFQGNAVFFEDIAYDEIPSFAEITKICENLVEKISTLNRSMNFKLDTSVESDGEYYLEYRSGYDDRIIYSNFIRFRFFEGYMQTRFSFAEANGYSAERKDIYSSDEILLTLMYEIKSIYGDMPVIITRMDIVYNLSQSSGSGDIQNATPYYRVYIQEQSEPFLIDAYFNTVVSNI